MRKLLVIMLAMTSTVFAEENTDNIYRTEKAEVMYQDSSPIESGVTAMFGLMKPDKSTLAGVGGRGFTDVYGGTTVMGDFAYELHLLDLVGPFSIRGSIGIIYDQGNGFRVDPDGVTSGSTTLEKFHFFGWPMSLGASYMLYFSRKQFVYPYAHTGFVWLPFFEMRSDTQGFHSGGNFNYQIAGGIRFLVDWINPKPAWRLDRDFGVNNSYISIEIRKLVSLTAKEMDFSNLALLFGIAFDV